MIEMTEIEPHHPRQKYRLTEKGMKTQKQWKK
jgi:DNA-binding HxlR family transcriptional regulator